MAKAPAAERLALYVDDRVPGAQGQSQGYQGLGRSGEAGCQRYHAKSKDIGGCAVELSCGLGLRAEEIRVGGQGETVCRGYLQKCSGTGHGRPRLDRDVRRAWRWRR